MSSFFKKENNEWGLYEEATGNIKSVKAIRPASAKLEDTVVMYIGDLTSEYKYGHFYRCTGTTWIDITNSFVVVCEDQSQRPLIGEEGVIYFLKFNTYIKVINGIPYNINEKNVMYIYVDNSWQIYGFSNDNVFDCGFSS